MIRQRGSPFAGPESGKDKMTETAILPGNVFSVFSGVILNFAGVLSCTVIAVMTAVFLIRTVREDRTEDR